MTRQPQYSLVAIGASTGGPGAVLQILRCLPVEFPLPILLAVHLGEQFATPLPELLQGESPLPVAYAKDGELLPKVGEGRVIMAPPDFHLVLRRGRLWLSADAERNSCRPSVDVLFESIAREAAKNTIACLLTGMGKDGAQGLLAIRRAGGRTISQDEATSVVYGMHREATHLRAADWVLPLQQFGPTLAMFGRMSRARLS